MSRQKEQNWLCVRVAGESFFKTPVLSATQKYKKGSGKNLLKGIIYNKSLCIF